MFGLGFLGLRRGDGFRLDLEWFLEVLNVILGNGVEGAELARPTRTQARPTINQYVDRVGSADPCDRGAVHEPAFVCESFAGFGQVVKVDRGTAYVEKDVLIVENLGSSYGS